MEDLAGIITRRKAEELLKDLISTPSISKQEEKLAAKVAALCRNIGLTSTIDRHGNVIAYRKWDNPGPRLALNTHLDTVDVSSHWTSPPFAAEIRDGRMYGLGACDCKGSMAAMLLALEAIQASNLELTGELYFTAVVQEEVQSVEAKGTVKLINDGFAADMVIVGEPTNLTICLGCEGMVEVEITTHGRSVHAANAESGINAIQHMMRAIAEINKIEPGFHPLFGKGSINVGVIAGGLRSSVVPDLCTAKISRFVVPGETGMSFLAEIEAALGRVRMADETFTAEARITYNSNAAIIDENEPIVGYLKKAATQFLKQDVPIVAMRAHLDTDFLINMAGIPSVAFGPGDVTIAHQADEFVKIDDVVTAANIYAHAIAHSLT